MLGIVCNRWSKHFLFFAFRKRLDYSQEKLRILNFEQLLHYKFTRNRVWTMCVKLNRQSKRNQDCELGELLQEPVHFHTIRMGVYWLLKKRFLFSQGTKQFWFLWLCQFSFASTHCSHSLCRLSGSKFKIRNFSWEQSNHFLNAFFYLSMGTQNFLLLFI